MLSSMVATATAVLPMPIWRAHQVEAPPRPTQCSMSSLEVEAWQARGGGGMARVRA